MHKRFQKNLFENIIFFSWIFIPILGKSEKSFHNSFLFKIENFPKIPFMFGRWKWFSSQKLSKFFHYLMTCTYMKPNSFSKNWLKIPPLLIYSPGYYCLHFWVYFLLLRTHMLTLITKCFGRFNFRTLASSERLNVRNFWCPKDKTFES